MKKNQNHLFSGDWGALVSTVRINIVTGRIVIKKKKKAEKQTNKEKEIALNGQWCMWHSFASGYHLNDIHHLQDQV